MIKQSKLLFGDHLLFLFFLILVGLIPYFSYAQKTECAEVKIVIEQKLAFERQAFDAKMVISNGLSTSDIKDISIELIFLDKNETVIDATSDSNNTQAKFFYKVDTLTGIEAIEGTGNILPKSTAEIHWLIIPSNHAVAESDELYYVGAKVNYTLNGVATSVEVTPDYIVVRPLPALSLDYFLPKKVYGNDPLTSEIEPSIPFTLGVLIKNTGYGEAYNVSIESAQPKIVSNDQNLFVQYEVLGSFVNDNIVDKSLNLYFGNIESEASMTGRWLMTSSLSGEFTDFNATYTHADELGGQVTSLVKEIKTHTLIHDVQRSVEDNVLGFLITDSEGLKLYDAQGNINKVQDISAMSDISLDKNQVKIIKPTTKANLFYLKVKDPFNGQKSLIGITTAMPNYEPQSVLAQNFWLSKEQNEDKTWTHYINLFHGPTTHTVYDVIFSDEKQSSLSGKVFYDQNHNGLQNENDQGVKNANVILTGLDNTGMYVNASVQTSQQGDFVFDQLNQGIYNISVEPLNGVVDGLALSGSMTGLSGKSSIQNIRLLSGEHIRYNTFAKLTSTSESQLAGEVDLSVKLLTPTINKMPSVGETFSFYVSVVNQGADVAKNSVVELQLPSHVELKGIDQKYHMTSTGLIELGDIQPKKPISFNVDIKVLRDQPISLTARVSSQMQDTNLSNNVYSIVIVPNTSK